MDIKLLFLFVVALLVAVSLITSLIVALRNRRSRRPDPRSGHVPGGSQHHPAQPPQQHAFPEHRGWYPPR